MLLLLGLRKSAVAAAAEGGEGLGGEGERAQQSVLAASHPEEASSLCEVRVSQDAVAAAGVG